jgi:L-malate glycosyltransferase
MKICYILNYPGSGGSEKYLLYLAREAKKAGHTVSFVFGEDGPFVEEVKKEGFSHEFIKMPWIFSPKASLKIKKYISQNNIDIIHCNFLREQALVAFSKVLGSKAKLVRTIHRADRFSSSVYLFMKVLSSVTDTVIVSANFLSKELVANGLKKISVIPNGVKAISLSKKGKGLGYLGRVDEDKGVVSLVSAADKMINLSLIIAGDGPDFEKIKKFRLKNLELIGRVDDPRILFERISVLVNPSKTEVMPLSYLEAFSVGIPVVGFDIPANKEIITDGMGVIVSGGYKDLLTVADNLAHDEKELAEISQKTKSEYQRLYTVEKMWQKTESVYKSLI